MTRRAHDDTDDAVVTILQETLADDPHPGVERVLARLHPQTTAGPMRRDWADTIQAADGRLVGVIDVDERADPEWVADSQFVRALGPSADDGFEQVYVTPGHEPAVRTITRDKLLTLCGRAVPVLAPYDDVRATFERAGRLDPAPDTDLADRQGVIRGP